MSVREPGMRIRLARHNRLYSVTLIASRIEFALAYACKKQPSGKGDRETVVDSGLQRNGRSAN